MILDMNPMMSLAPPFGGCASHVYSLADSTKDFELDDPGRLDGPANQDSWRDRPWELLEPGAPEEPSAVAKRRSRKSGKSSYKHVPHREKPPHLVARRNARERRRVQAVNSAFSRLRKCVPNENRNKRLSKVKTLHRAIEYIQTLQEMLDQADAELDGPAGPGPGLPAGEGLGPSDGRSESALINKENEAAHRWLALDVANWDQDTHSSCLSFYDDFADQMQS